MATLRYQKQPDEVPSGVAPSLQPDEDFFQPRIPGVAALAVAAAFSVLGTARASEDFVPPPTAAVVDEDAFRPTVLSPAPALRLLRVDEDVPSLYGQPDEDFPPDYLFPPAPVRYTPPVEAFQDPEELPAGFLHGATDEDFWDNPAPLQARQFAPRAVTADDDLPVIPTTLAPDEDFYRPPVPPPPPLPVIPETEDPAVPYDTADLLAPFGIVGNNYPAQGYTVYPWQFSINITESVGQTDPLGGNAASALIDNSATTIHATAALAPRAPISGRTYRYTAHFAPGTYPGGAYFLANSVAVAVYVTNAGAISVSASSTGTPFNLQSTPEANGFFKISFDYVSDGGAGIEFGFGDHALYSGSGQTIIVWGVSVRAVLNSEEDGVALELLTVPPVQPSAPRVFLDTDEVPTSAVTFQPDEDFWLPPVPSSPAPPKPVQGDTDEVAVVPPDEDFYRPPVQPPTRAVRAFADTDELPTALFVDEDFYRPAVLQPPPIVRAFQDTDEWPTPPVTVLPGDEDFWLPPRRPPGPLVRAFTQDDFWVPFVPPPPPEGLPILWPFGAIDGQGQTPFLFNAPAEGSTVIGGETGAPSATGSSVIGGKPGTAILATGSATIGAKTGDSAGSGSGEAGAKDGQPAGHGTDVIGAVDGSS